MFQVFRMPVSDTLSIEVFLSMRFYKCYLRIIISNVHKTISSSIKKILILVDKSSCVRRISDLKRWQCACKYLT